MMIARIEEPLQNNEAFVAEQLRQDANYFAKLADGQHPEFLWIGCSDSRVAPDRITGTGKTSIVQKSWAISGKPYVHGWVFDIGTGYIRSQTGMINSDAAIRRICKFGNRVVGNEAAEHGAVVSA